MTNTNVYNNLISFMLNADRRKQVLAILRQTPIEPPYDLIIKILADSEESYTKAEFLAISKGQFSQPVLDILEAIPETVSHKVGYRALSDVIALSRISKITHILSAAYPPRSKLIRIAKHCINLPSGKSNVKLSTELQQNPSSNLFTFCGYNISRGMVMVLCAYPGLGKTTLMLSLIRELAATLRVLYICIADWTESTLKDRIPMDFPVFYCSLYGNAGIAEIETDVELVQPDVVFVDYIGVVSTPSMAARRYQLEYVVKSLHSIANIRNCAVVTAHQLNTLGMYVDVEHLLEVKAGLLAHCDLVLGIGGNQEEGVRNVTTLKVRHERMMGEQKIYIDFDSLTYRYEDSFP